MRKFRLFFFLVAIGILSLGTLFLLSKNATAPGAAFRDCVRSARYASTDDEGNLVCRRPDGSTIISSEGGESDLTVTSFRTADPMFSGLLEQNDVVITTSREFDELWQRLFGHLDPDDAPPKPAAVSDSGYFDQSVVIGLFAGEKPTGGYSIEPLMIWEEADRVEIVVKETVPLDAATDVITTPYDIFSIPNRQKPIIFIHVTDREKQQQETAPENRY